MKAKAIHYDKFYLMFLAIVAFTIPLPMLLNNLSIISLCLFWLWLCYKKEVVKPNMKSFILLTIPYIILIIGSVYSSNIQQLTTELTKSLPFLILPLIILTVPVKLTTVRFKMVLKAFILGNVSISLFLFGIIFYHVLNNGLTIETLWGLTHQNLSEYVQINAIYLSMYLGLSLMVLIYFFNRDGEGSLFQNRFVNMLFMCILILIMIFLSSRTVLITIAILITIIYFQKRIRKESIIKVTLRFLVISVFLVVGTMYINPVLKWRLGSVFDIQDTQFTVGKEEGIQMRQKLWSSSLEVFKDHWLFGVGSGDFLQELEEIYKEKEYRIQYRHHMNSHNQYLSYMVSNGIFGLLMFFIYMIFPIKLYINNQLWLLVFISLLFACCFLTESYLYTNKGVVVISFFMTLMYAYSKDALNFVDSQNKLSH